MDGCKIDTSKESLLETISASKILGHCLRVKAEEDSERWGNQNCIRLLQVIQGQCKNDVERFPLLNAKIVSQPFNFEADIS